jgi:hypothetical protein
MMTREVDFGAYHYHILSISAGRVTRKVEVSVFDEVILNRTCMCLANE